MEDQVNWLVQRLSDEGVKTAKYFRGLLPDEWGQRIYSDGASWNVKQILMHIISTEEAIYWLLRDIEQGGNGTPENFDLDLFNEKKVQEMQEAPTDDLIEVFLSKRSRTISNIQTYSSEDLSKTGRHPFLGVASVDEIVKLLYRHIQIHIRDIRRTVGGYR